MTMFGKVAALGVAAVLGLGGLSLAFAAPQDKPEAEPAHTCIDAGHLSRKMVVDKNTVLVEDYSGRSALLKLSAPCRNLDELDKIGFEFNGSTQICDRRDVKILYSRFTEAPVRCLIEEVVPLSKAEAAKY